MTEALVLPATIAGRYAPIRLIGRGGVGTVYEVEHVRTGERLALKVLPSSTGATGPVLERFKREARASVRIKSEHVVRVIDADVAPELNNSPFIVMELLDGADLEHAAKASPPSPAQVVDWLRQIAGAIDRAHGLGIVHRDLKPDNLFLARREDGATIVKILDFGIVKMIEEGTWVTASDEIMGTPKYMAPEQATAGSPVTPATDRFALGLVAYRLLTGETYYQGDVVAIIGQILHDPMQPPSKRHPQLGPAFDAWFARACNRDTAARFPTAGEQVEALAAVLGQPPATPAPAEASGPGTRIPVAGPGRANVGMRWAIGAVSIGAAIFAAWAILHRG